MVAAMSSRLSDYDYDLPEHLIAHRPLSRRKDSRMMVLHRNDQRIEHRTFADFESYLRSGDVVVLNNTRVLAARRFSDDGKIEFLFLERLDALRWKCLVKPGRKMKIGATVQIVGSAARVETILADGERIIALDREIDLHTGGLLPLPPYVGRQSDVEDETRYQTVFAQIPGALAAPTAGLHFTPEILNRIPHVFVTLHVGTGTFRPVQSEDLSDHRMHAERFSVSAEAAKSINGARRIAAIGTTTVRVLASAQRMNGSIMEQESATAIFIRPPHKFRSVDLLLTNFHLPRSTLLMLVSAFAGREFVLAAYAEAIREKYRFFSYGDCMLIL